MARSTCGSPTSLPTAKTSNPATRPTSKGDKRIAFAILTDEPNELVARYHDRMPLALADDKVGIWLDLAVTEPLQGNLLLDLAEFAVRPMDRAMNNARQKDLAAIDPAA